MLTPSVKYYSLCSFRRRIEFVSRRTSFLRVSVGSNGCIGAFNMNPSFVAILGGIIGGPVSTRLVIGRPRSCVRTYTRTNTTCVAPRASYVRDSTFMAVGGVVSLNYGTKVTLGPTTPLRKVERCLPLLSGMAVVVISTKCTKRGIVARVCSGVHALMR